MTPSIFFMVTFINKHVLLISNMVSKIDNIALFDVKRKLKYSAQVITNILNPKHGFRYISIK